MVFEEVTPSLHLVVVVTLEPDLQSEIPYKSIDARNCGELLKFVESFKNPEKSKHILRGPWGVNLLSPGTQFIKYKFSF
jgi:hypothetical protein